MQMKFPQFQTAILNEVDKKGAVAVAELTPLEKVIWT
jgi:hypothetical protein